MVANEPFNALGKDVPAEVTNALKLDKINIQKQIDLPYLILETPGQVAATFNRFTNLDRIDEAIALISSDLRDRAAKKNEVDEQLTTVQAELRGYAYLDGFEKLVEVYEEVHTELDTALSKNTTLLECIDAGKRFTLAAEKYDEQIRNKQKTLKQARDLMLEIANFDSKIVKIEKSELELSRMVEVYQGAQARLDEIMLHLPSWQKEMALQKKLLALGARVEVVESKATLLKDALDDITNLGAKLQRAECALTDLHTALSKEKAKLAQIDTCITCGQKLTVVARETMLHNIKHEG
jgi:tetratricopeptide (TPR) repeat protein